MIVCCVQLIVMEDYCYNAAFQHHRHCFRMAYVPNVATVTGTGVKNHATATCWIDGTFRLDYYGQEEHVEQALEEYFALVRRRVREILRRTTSCPT